MFECRNSCALFLGTRFCGCALFLCALFSFFCCSTTIPALPHDFSENVMRQLEANVTVIVCVMLR